MNIPDYLVNCSNLAKVASNAQLKELLRSIIITLTDELGEKAARLKPDPKKF